MTIQKRSNATGFAPLGIVLPLLVCSAATTLRAEDEQPNIALSMYFVSEKVACSPHGYGEPGQPYNCPDLTFTFLEKMVSQGVATPVQQSIPPERLRLGRSLFDSVDAFSDDCTISAPCADEPERRYAIILAFEFSDAPRFSGQTIEITRNPPMDSPFEPYSRKGKLSERGRWINHQRADVFLPSHGVRWALRLGDWTWNLGTEQ